MGRKRQREIFFTSDLHFGHAKVIEYSNRPFKSVEEMDERLIKNWNQQAGPEDTIIVVGDFFMYHKKEKLREIMSRLNGYKILVRGNHDMTAPEMFNIGFHHVCESMTMRIANETVNISHYPYRTPWYKVKFYNFLNKLFPKRFFKPRVFAMQLKSDGRFLIHGHTHDESQAIPERRMIHVGTDAWGYKLVPFAKVANIIGAIKNNQYKEEK